MMDNIERVVDILFRRVSSERILRERMDGTSFSERDFVLLIRNYEKKYSDNELQNMYTYLSDNFLSKYYGIDEETYDMERGLNVFSLLKCYSSWILTFQGNEITCEYSKMFHWRNISLALSEDLLVASFLADREWRRDEERQDFGWKPFLTHNNEELRKIVKAGMCENHYHLKGSAPIFQLAWVCLMNDVVSEQILSNLAIIEQDRRNSNLQYGKEYSEISFSKQIAQAALIRTFLASALLEKEIEIGDYHEIRHLNPKEHNNYDELWRDLTEKNVRYLLENTDALLMMKGVIQEQIMALRNIRVELKYPDYAIHGISSYRDQNQKSIAYHGERWFLYSMLKKLYSNNEKFCKYQDLFYAYLVIKENIRAEMIQINDYVGFENFRVYQDRKEFFLTSPFFDNLLVKEAVQSSLFDSNVLTLEARIAPKCTQQEMAEQIQKLDNLVCGDDEMLKKRFFYTVHFIKTGREKYKDGAEGECRHYRLRENVKEQAMAISQMRENYPIVADRIRGIDAANTEIGCGPEVFAQTFRYLSDHMVKRGKMRGNSIPQLHITYHAGEDFLDMVSGLRAIDEAIHFLGMKCGARLGHALVLGIEPSEWYELKNHRILIPQQEYLDNVAWLYHMLKDLQIPESTVLRAYLQKEFDYYFGLIYRGAIDVDRLEYIREKALAYYKKSRWEKFYQGNHYQFGIENYYRAWCLRGDNPEAYKKGFFENGYDKLDIGNKYKRYCINERFPLKQEERYLQETSLLYYLYHYDNMVKEQGEKCIEIKIKPFWIEVIRMVQQGMQRRVADYGIGIETNPSSNCLIGTFKKYIKHPIIRFYNKGLVTEPEKLAECEQLNVSINTDDQGVFNSSLENEYAYMALALEKAKDKDGKHLYKKTMIYQWLDDIRRMGIRQTFLSESEMQEILRKR